MLPEHVTLAHPPQQCKLEEKFALKFYIEQLTSSPHADMNNPNRSSNRMQIIHNQSANVRLQQNLHRTVIKKFRKNASIRLTEQASHPKKKIHICSRGDNNFKQHKLT